MITSVFARPDRERDRDRLMRDSADFPTVLGHARAHDLARLIFWSADRDRPCPGACPHDETCSEVPRQAWDFTRTFAQYGG
jgi:hypothetical protein